MKTRSAYFSIVGGSYGPLVETEIFKHLGLLKSAMIEFTLMPTDSGKTLFGNREEKIMMYFQVVSMGIVEGTEDEDPKSIKLLGRLNPIGIGAVPKALNSFFEYQWEAIYNPRTKQGTIYKLDKPLPDELVNG